MTQAEALLNQLQIIEKEMEKDNELEAYARAIRNVIRTMKNDLERR